MGIPRLLTVGVTAAAALSLVAPTLPAFASTSTTSATARAGAGLPGPAGNPVWARRTTDGVSAAALQTVACGATSADAAMAVTLAASMTYSRMGQLLTADQVACARRVVAAARATGLDRKGAEISLMTAMVETTLHDYTGGDLDSVGLFQQRSSWGTYAQRISPETATGLFLTVMQQIYPNNSWLTAPSGQVAADVQRPAAAYRGEYALAQTSADALLDALWPAPATSPTPTPTPTPTPAPTPKPIPRPATLRVLRLGMQGADVKYAQQLLNLLNAHLGVDGDDGPATTAAIKTFQRQQHLSVDGIVGPITWAHLQAAAGQQSGPVSKPTSNPKPVSTSRQIPRPATLRVLHLGMQGADVKYAQQLLNLLNAHLGVDGDDGAVTSAAIKAFQRQQHLSVDGIVGPVTWAHLQAASGQ